VNAPVGATMAASRQRSGPGFYIQIVTGNMRPDSHFAGILLPHVLGPVLFGLVTLQNACSFPGNLACAALSSHLEPGKKGCEPMDPPHLKH